MVQKIQILDSPVDGHNALGRRRRKKLKRHWDIGKHKISKEEQINLEDDTGDWNDSSTLDEDDEDWKGSSLDIFEGNKAAKAAKRIAKHQARFRTILEADIEHIEHALHPDVTKVPRRKVGDNQSLTNNNIIESNITFNPHCFEWSSLRQGVNDKRTIKNDGPPKIWVDPQVEEQKLMQAIFERLGISAVPTNHAKERKILLARLKAAIKSDLIADGNEQEETMQRMAGYWRYVNRRTYNAMVHMNELYDWATGQKLPEIDETELEEDLDEDRESLGGCLKVETPSANAGNAPKTPEWEGRAAREDREDPTPKLTTSNHSEGDLARLLRRQQISYSEHDEAVNDNCMVLPPSTPSAGSENSLRNTTEDSHASQKDTRVLSKAIRAASPARKDTHIAPPRCSKLKATPSTLAKDLSSKPVKLANQFGFLENDIPAPCDEPQLPSPEPPKRSKDPRALRTPSQIGNKKESAPALSSTSSTPITTAAAAAINSTKPAAKQPPKILNITTVPSMSQSSKGGLKTTKRIKTPPFSRSGGRKVIVLATEGFARGVEVEGGDGAGTGAKELWTDVVVRGRKGRR